MSFFQNSSDQRTAEYNLYFRLMSEGLANRSAVEFHDDLETIAENAIDPALREKARKEMLRYGGYVATAANSQ